MVLLPTTHNQQPSKQNTESNAQNMAVGGTQRTTEAKPRGTSNPKRVSKHTYSTKTHTHTLFCTHQQQVLILTKYDMILHLLLIIISLKNDR
jgi:hypothetical protein